jgi:hypothetical protein
MKMAKAKQRPTKIQEISSTSRKARLVPMQTGLKEATKVRGREAATHAATFDQSHICQRVMAMGKWK